MKAAEVVALRRILPSYVSYLKNNPYSMIAKIYGMFTLKRKWMSPITFMLMENTIQLMERPNLLATFDLKGSTHGRRSKGTVKPSTV